MMEMLRPNPNLRDSTAKAIAEDIYSVAEKMVSVLPDSPELTAGLRKLLEAKDCLVRCAVFSVKPAVDYRDR
jgi:hypothetical protein